MYQSVTFWRTEDYLIEILVGGFTSVEEAAKFASKGAKGLAHGHTPEHMVFIDGNGIEHQLLCHKWRIIDGRSKSIGASKLRSEFKGKVHLSGGDFTNVDIKAEADAIVSSFNRGFELITYGVMDSEGNHVGLKIPEDA